MHVMILPRGLPRGARTLDPSSPSSTNLAFYHHHRRPRRCCRHLHPSQNKSIAAASNTQVPPFSIVVALLVRNHSSQTRPVVASLGAVSPVAKPLLSDSAGYRHYSLPASLRTFFLVDPLATPAAFATAISSCFLLSRTQFYPHPPVWTLFRSITDTHTYSHFLRIHSSQIVELKCRRMLQNLRRP